MDTDSVCLVLAKKKFQFYKERVKTRMGIVTPQML